MVVEWADEVGEDGAGAGLDEGFDRHAGDQAQAAEAGDFGGRDGDADCVVAVPVFWSSLTSAEMADFAVELRRGALVEGGEAQHGELADAQLVDVLRRDSWPRRRASSASGTISMIGSPGAITPPTVWTAS